MPEIVRWPLSLQQNMYVSSNNFNLELKSEPKLLAAELHFRRVWKNVYACKLMIKYFSLCMKKKKNEEGENIKRQKMHNKKST
jgi:hypothetical protein